MGYPGPWPAGMGPLQELIGLFGVIGPVLGVDQFGVHVSADGVLLTWHNNSRILVCLALGQGASGPQESADWVAPE